MTSSEHSGETCADIEEDTKTAPECSKGMNRISEPSPYTAEKTYTRKK